MADDPQAVGTPPAKGQIEPPDPLGQNREAAIRRAMAMAGLAPGGFSPMHDAIIKNASALVNQLVLEAYNRGDNSLETPQAALGALADLIRRGAQGAKIFGGASAAGGIEAMRSAAEAGAAGTGTNMQSLAAALLKDPTNTEALFAQARYGGLGETARAAATHALGTIIDAWRRQTEEGGPAATNPAGLLDILMGKPVRSFQAPGDIFGTGAGGNTSGAVAGAGGPQVTPSALSQPAAAGGAIGQLGALAALGTPNPTLAPPGPPSLPTMTPPPQPILGGMQVPQPPAVQGSAAMNNLGLIPYMNPY